MFIKHRPSNTKSFPKTNVSVETKVVEEPMIKEEIKELPKEEDVIDSLINEEDIFEAIEKPKKNKKKRTYVPVEDSIEESSEF